MKKIIISLVMVLTAFASAFAGEENIDQRVVKAFGKEFTKAKDVKWSVEAHLYKATFTYRDNIISAYYDKNARLISVIRHMLSTDLPYHLQRELKEYYSDYWVTNLFEMTKENAISYHVVLKNAAETIILSSSDEQSWEIFKQFENQ